MNLGLAPDEGINICQLPPGCAAVTNTPPVSGASNSGSGSAPPASSFWGWRPSPGGSKGWGTQQAQAVALEVSAPGSWAKAHHLAPWGRKGAPRTGRCCRSPGLGCPLPLQRRECWEVGGCTAECGQWGGPQGEVEASALDGGSHGQSLSMLRAGSTLATLGWCELGFGVVGDIGQVGWQGGSLPG